MAYCKKMKRIDVVYLAGLFDGEGCITSILTFKACRAHRGRSRRGLSVVTSLANTNHPVMEWCLRTTGIGQLVRIPAGGKRKKTCWRHVVSSMRPMESMLTQLSPYLRVKARQAELALAFLRSRLARTARTNRAEYSEEEIRLLFDLRIANAHYSKSKVFRFKNVSYTLPQFRELVLAGRHNERCHVVEWTEEMDARLGTDSDREVAGQLGLKLAAVQRRRYKLKIRPAKATRWSEEHYNDRS